MVIEMALRQSVREIRLVTLDKRGPCIYSASLLVPSSSRPIYHHVSIWVDACPFPDFSGEISVEMRLLKYSCTCEDFVFKNHECKHVKAAFRYVRPILEDMIKKEWRENGGNLW